MGKVDYMRKSANFVGSRPNVVMAMGQPEGASNMYDPTKSM